MGWPLQPGSVAETIPLMNGIKQRLPILVLRKVKMDLIQSVVFALVIHPNGYACAVCDFLPDDGKTDGTVTDSSTKISFPCTKMLLTADCTSILVTGTFWPADGHCTLEWCPKAFASHLSSSFVVDLRACLPCQSMWCWLHDAEEM